MHGQGRLDGGAPPPGRRRRGSTGPGAIGKAVIEYEPISNLLGGGPGADTLDGGGGNDKLRCLMREPVDGAERFRNGSDGDDSITGGADRDYLDGEGGNDTLIGGASRDLLVGGAGDDSLVGGAEGDTFFGGPGADMLIIAGGRNWIMDFDEDDRLAIGMNLAQVQAAATQLGADLHVALAGGGDLYLANTTLTEIEADNLI